MVTPRVFEPRNSRQIANNEACYQLQLLAHHRPKTFGLKLIELRIRGYDWTEILAMSPDLPDYQEEAEVINLKGYQAGL